MTLQELSDFGLGCRLGQDEAHSLSSAELLSLLHRYGVLVLDQQPDEPDAFVARANSLGRLEEVNPPEHRLPGSPYIRLQSNVPGVGAAGGGTYWHADSAWYEPPAAATLLFCKEAPEAGGETLFLDMRAFLASLPAELRSRVEGLHGVYPCNEILKREHEAMGLYHPEMWDSFADITRPLVRSHPVNGFRFVYLNEKWLARIGELDSIESAALLDDLYARMSDSPFHYRHSWEPSQLLIWDNNVVTHKACPVADGARKITWRIILKSYPN